MSIAVLAGDGATVTEGGTWVLVLEARSFGLRYWGPDVDLTVTVQPPTGPAVPVAAETSGGLWVAEYVTAEPGRHVAQAVTTGYGTAAAVATVRPVVAAAGMPDVDELRVYLGENSASDDEISDALAAETDAQGAACRIPAAYPNDLRQALKRRVARNLAMRGIPLAVLQGDPDAGDATVLPGNDPEVRRFERPWRRLKMG